MEVPIIIYEIFINVHTVRMFNTIIDKTNRK